MKSVFRATRAACLAVRAIPAIAESLTTASMILLAKVGIASIKAGSNASPRGRRVASPIQTNTAFAFGDTGAGEATTAGIFDSPVW
jgi:hypothetical protein